MVDKAASAVEATGGAELSRPATAQVFGVKFWNQRWLSILIAEKFALRAVFVASFEQALQAAADNSAVFICWAASLSAQQCERVREVGGYFLEDGFIRSVGLGAGLNPGLSYVFDRKGIYYNSQVESELENLLQTLQLDAQQLARGRQLRQLLVEKGISKYNLQKSTIFTDGAEHRQRILVVGQVENDASILANPAPLLAEPQAGNINLKLLHWSRQQHPQAFIVYKPHPDVAADLRPGKIEPEDLARLADQVVVDGDIVTLIDWCEELHTVSSLAGFEALVRGKTVVTHGGPFYAGWGLTRDGGSFPRRSKQISVDALVYILLVKYGNYVEPQSGLVCAPEVLIDYLSKQKASRLAQLRASVLTAISWLARKVGL